VLNKAKSIAKDKGLELIPHKKGGKISNTNRYWNDPNPYTIRKK
jgi:hypothetical protein